MKENSIPYKLLIAFIMIQPFLDINYLYSDNIINVFKFSPSTIIRMIVTFILTIFILKKVKGKKEWSFVVVSLIIIATYTLLHHITNTDFTSLVPDNFNYSLKSDLFYIIRMCIPLVIIYSTYKFNISDQDFYKTIRVILILVSGSIVLTNLLKIGLASYSNNGELIKDNIFGWFNGAYELYSYTFLASKGWFYGGNPISALLALLLPVMMYITILENKKSDILIVVITILSMIILGTKVALFGSILITAIIFTMYIIFKIINKDKSINKNTIAMFSIIVVLFAIVVPKSPALNREYEAEKVHNQEESEAQEYESNQIDSPESNGEDLNSNNHEDQNNNENNNKNDIDEKQNLINYIGENYNDYMIYPPYIENSYPYKYDPEFWIEIMEQPIEKRLNYRFIQESMLKRVMDINNDKVDKLFGMSYSRTQNIYNLERDFMNQYYALGIIGMIIFLGPYIAIILYSAYIVLFKDRKKFNLLNLTLMFSLSFMLAVSYYSGNVIDSLTVVIIFAFLMGKLLKNIENVDDVENI